MDEGGFEPSTLSFELALIDMLTTQPPRLGLQLYDLLIVFLIKNGQKSSSFNRNPIFITRFESGWNRHSNLVGLKYELSTIQFIGPNPLRLVLRFHLFNHHSKVNVTFLQSTQA